MNQIEARNYKTKTGETIKDRMLSYENITNIHLIKKQAAILRISCVNSKDIKVCEDIESAFLHSALEICNEVETITFAYYCMNEVSFFLKDYSFEKQNQYYAGNIQKIISVITSKFTNYFNFYCLVNEMEINDSAVFEGRLFNIPTHEIITNFIWRQREHIRTNKDNNGFSLYKVPIELKVDDLSDEIIDTLVHKGTQPPDTVERMKWIIDEQTPIFSENKPYLIEKI